MKDFCLYTPVTNPTLKTIMTMTASQWGHIDVITLRLTHSLLQAQAIANSAKLVASADTVTCTQTEATSFIKHVQVILTDKGQCLHFYYDLVIQAAAYSFYS